MANVVTLQDLKDKLKEEFDEVIILEKLEITADELVEVFSDKIEDKFEQLARELFDSSGIPEEAEES